MCQLGGLGTAGLKREHRGGVSPVLDLAIARYSARAIVLARAMVFARALALGRGRFAFPLCTRHGGNRVCDNFLPLLIRLCFTSCYRTSLTYVRARAASSFTSRCKRAAPTANTRCASIRDGFVWHHLVGR